MKYYLILITLALCSSLNAKTWYVAPNGNDGQAGTLSSPFKTIDHAIEMADPGDEIQLRNGVHTSNEIRITKSNLTIRSYPGEWAKIICPLNIEDATSCIWYSEPDVVGGLLENLEITGGYLYGIKFETNWDWGVPDNERHGVRDVIVRNCKIHDTGRDCIKITPACDHLQFISCEIYSSGVGPSNDPNDPNAEGIDNVNGSNMVVRNCYIHHTSTTGVYAKGGAKDCLIEGNLVMNTGEGGILLGFYTDAEYFDATTNPSYYENIGGVARNNIVINTGGAGIGFFGALNAKAYNNTVSTASPKYHAPLFCNTAEVWINDNLTLYTPNRDIEIFNNIFIDNSGTGDEDYTAQIRENALSGTNYIDRNIYYKTTGPAIFDDGISWPALTFNQWKSQLLIDANSQLTDPKVNANFHLIAGSPAIDAGANPLAITLTDYDGGNRSGTFDIGADEFNAGSPLTIPPAANIIGTGAGAGTTFVLEHSEAAIFEIYPNPAVDWISVKNAPPSLQMTLTDVSGNVLKVSTKNEISLTGLPVGVYFVMVKTPEKAGIYPIIKQ